MVSAMRPGRLCMKACNTHVIEKFVIVKLFGVWLDFSGVVVS